jgi:hypothetical protein
MSVYMGELIRLHNIEGIARLSGTDEHGCQWLQFEVDAFAEQESGECSICGETISEGWTCLDGGDEVCSEHIAVIDYVKEKGQ